MKESSIWGPDVEWTEQGGGERANHGRLGAVKSSSITHAAPLPRLEFVRKHWLDTQPCGTPLSLHAARMKSPVPVLISFTWKNILHRCWFQEFPGIHNVEDELLVHSGAKEPVRAPPGVLLSPHSPPPPPARTYRQVLRGEAAQTRQVPPGGSVELLHLLRQLLLETPLLLVLLSVSELHHNRWRAALWSDTAESGEGVTAWPTPLRTLSQRGA